MADPRFFKNAGPLRLSQLAECSGATLAEDADPDQEISDVAPVDTAGPEHVSFLDNAKYTEVFKTTRAGACFVSPDQAANAPEGTACLITEAPYKAYALAAQAFYTEEQGTDGQIAETAHIDPSAELGEGVTVEPGAVVGKNVKIGDKTIIHSNATIGEAVEIGAQCIIGTGASISHTIIGNKVHIYPGACIGQRGFGFALDKEGYVSVPQLGLVVIEDDVEVGANSTIDRGAIGDTVIGAGTRIDNLVQIAHGVKIGRGCVIVAQAGIAGSAELGDFVMVGGQVGIAGHLKIGSGARIAAQAGIMRDVEAGADLMGSPAVPGKQFMRQVATLSRMVNEKKGKKTDE